MSVLIGISGSIIVDEGGRFPGYKRAYVNNDYIESAALSGGVPVILPVLENEDMIKAQADQIDGLILSGGQDVNPLLYGEEPTTKTGSPFLARDRSEELLLKHVIQQRKPVLAICRGLQILNVAYGGTLYQDLSDVEGSFVKHDQYKNTSDPSHSITILEESHLHTLFGSETLINSFHHQAIKDVAPGFIASAWAKDGVIEAIEKQGESFVVGVQWHPEMMAKEHESMLHLFKLFMNHVEQAKKTSQALS
ncbi:gamma-glutamyl-gamma-aminobutyrate hydrolase family protein [Priestia koreensis]|uniref:gamma-glutamyl-gamma-aminobutyrate hydrolase family protein n=1 Tax=Priestia koreensis TaxID=284581 RepID=UPI001F5952B2|nr:gamma-glutamyl-gamma-aminobutyrate hydrolase family protein [Priestia koreensis]UNL83276.1 gamma-glutamyl-gamma-aminobutyrate hydrolase family protein [Priestia koreensis]